MRPTVIVRMLAASALTWLLLLPAGAAAFPAKGACGLTLTSVDGNGNVLDTASAGDASASADDPLLVDWDGALAWEGRSSISLRDSHYHVAMFGMATPFQGAAANTADARTTAGRFAFSATAPFRVTGTYFVSVGIIGSGGECSGTFVVRLTGDPIGTVPFFLGLALLAIGALLLALGLRGQLGAAIAGGLSVGLGAALEAVIFSVLPLAGLTPVALVAGGAVLAVVSAVVGGRRISTLEPGAEAPEPAEDGGEPASG